MEWGYVKWRCHNCGVSVPPSPSTHITDTNHYSIAISAHSISIAPTAAQTGLAGHCESQHMLKSVS